MCADHRHKASEGAATRDPGPKPELRWIPLTQLCIPTEYQRSVKSDASVKNINYIKENFNWGDCGALIVCPMAKDSPLRYAVIDGQHRFRAAEARGGIKELPCVVIAERAPKEQAKNFGVINGKRVKLNPLQEYHAAVVAGDPDAVGLRAILEKCQVKIAAQPVNLRETHPRVTLAVGTLLKMLQEHSEKQIVWVLTIIPEAYGDRPGMLRSSFIRGLARFIKANPLADRGLMVAALRKLDIDSLEKDARAFKQIEGGSTTSAIQKVLERKYNAAKKTEP